VPFGAVHLLRSGSRASPAAVMREAMEMSCLAILRTNKNQFHGLCVQAVIQC